MNFTDPSGLIPKSGVTCPGDGFPWCPSNSDGFFGSIVNLIYGNPLEANKHVEQINSIADDFVDEVQDSAKCHVTDLLTSDTLMDGLLEAGAPVAIDENSFFIGFALAGKMGFGMAKSQNGEVMVFSSAGAGAGVGAGGGKTFSVANQLPSSDLSTTFSGGVGNVSGEYSAELQGSDFRSVGGSGVAPAKLQIGSFLTIDQTNTLDCTEILK